MLFIRYPASIIVIALTTSGCTKEDLPPATEIARGVLVVSTGNGNVLISAGPDGAFVVGATSARSTDALERLIAARTSSSVRYVLIEPQRVERSQGDGGWQRRGAVTFMHENALRRLVGDVMAAPLPLPQRLRNLRVERPLLAFSDVLSLDLNGESIHVVHQPSGYSDADALTHFHLASIVYLGADFPGDGYPEIDKTQGGTLEGLVKTLDGWATNSARVVPVRGPIATGADVAAFRNMIVEVTARIRKLKEEGVSVERAVSEHVTHDFGGRWGNGRVLPETFVREVYSAVSGA